MKKAIAFAILLIISVTSFSQQTTPSPALTKQDYLKKSKHQKTAAWACIGGGAGLLLTGKILSKNYSTPNDFQKRNHLSRALILAGISTMLVSIPFFIAAKQNKWESSAINAFLKMEAAPQLQYGSFISLFVPSLTLKISL